MMDTQRHKGSALADRGNIRVKTFIFDIQDAEDGFADIEVNDFCAEVRAMSIVLDRYNSKMIYRILYKVENED